MATLTIDKCEEYIGYAEQCLELAEIIADRELRVILREMAAEWLRLTDEQAAAGQAAHAFDRQLT